MYSAISLLAFQIALQFPYRFWDSKVQGADFFGHVPPSASQRGLFAVFYDMGPQVTCGMVWIPCLEVRAAVMCHAQEIGSCRDPWSVGKVKEGDD